jgi:DNA repair exonuclease SbcCD ATPase subunit
LTKEAIPDQRLLNAKLSEANREITKLRQENHCLRHTPNEKMKGSTSPRSTAELKNIITKLQKENQDLKFNSTNGNKARNALEVEKRKNQRLESTIQQLQNKVETENTDSMASFIENESKIELGALRKKYDKTMERLLTIEEHVRDTGGTLPHDAFWDGLQ